MPILPLVVGLTFTPTQSITTSTGTTSTGEAIAPIQGPPAGVMGSHDHPAGMWMVGYRFQLEHYVGMRDGENGLDPEEVLGQGFTMTPTRMSMEMHVLDVMYGVSDDVTVCAMLPYLRNEMRMKMDTGERFTTRSEGFGDLAVSVEKRWRDEAADGSFFVGTLGLSFPTASISERDDAPGSADARLEYPMQLGSGTYDFLPGFGWAGPTDGDWSYGSRIDGRLRIGSNDHDYSLGDRIDITGWMNQRVSARTIASARMHYAAWGNVDGADDALDVTMSPTNDADRQGGERADVAAGIRLAPCGSGDLGLELGIPVHEDLNGPQPDLDWTASVSARFGF